MNKLQTQVNSYVSNEGNRRQFMNFYRLVKTHSLLNSLFLSDSISRETFNMEIKETLEKINLLKNQLEKQDLRRFCELWGIETQYLNLGKMDKMIDSSIKVGTEVVKISNMIPMITDEVLSANTYGQIHEPYSNFCIYLMKMKKNEKNFSPSLKKTVDDLLDLETSLSRKYQRFNESLSEDSRDQLKEALTKFRVEFQKAYQL